MKASVHPSHGGRGQKKRILPLFVRAPAPALSSVFLRHKKIGEKMFGSGLRKDKDEIAPQIRGRLNRINLLGIHPMRLEVGPAGTIVCIVDNSDFRTIESCRMAIPAVTRTWTGWLASRCDADGTVQITTRHRTLAEAEGAIGGAGDYAVIWSDNRRASA